MGHFCLLQGSDPTVCEVEVAAAFTYTTDAFSNKGEERKTSTKLTVTETGTCC